MMRRYGSTPRPDQRYRMRPGVYAILPRDGALLLTYQDDPHYEFQLPGGGIYAGEHPITALHREVFEETGWKIGPPQRLGAYRRFTYMPEYDLWAEKVCHIYMARPVRRHGPPIEVDHTAVWMSPDEALALLNPIGDADFLAAAYGSGLF